MKKNKLKKVLICLFSFLFIASATVAGGVLLSGSSYSTPASEDAQDNENLTNVTVNATEPLNDGNWTDSGNYDTSISGSGTESSPYLISTAEELAGLAYNVNNGTNYSGIYFEQTTDIDLSSYWWDAIGTYSSASNYNEFAGHYDGGGHTISGVFTKAGSDSSYSYQGLFGYVRGTSSTNRAEISNVGVINSNIQGYQYVGGIAGRAYCTNITNCYNTSSVTGSSSYVGGVVGRNDSSSTVENSYNTGSVTGNNLYVGGVVGNNNSSSIVSNSYNTGSVTSNSLYVGGVVGYNYASSTVENSYNTGTVTGSSDSVGGVVGYNYNSSIVTNCYNTGLVTGNSQFVGGVVGMNYSSTVSNSYNTGSVLEGSYAGGVVGENYLSTVSNSYNIGSVSGNGYLGGVVGRNYNGADLYNSFNTGSVTGTGSNIGAIVGYNSTNSPTVYNCYWGGNCTQTSAYGYNDGTVSNCEQFSSDSDPETESWYTTTSNWYSSYTWNFSSTWGISQYVNEGYPFLRGVGVGADLPTNYDSMWTDSGVTRDTTFSGSGTEDDPYLISSAEELAGLAYLTNISTSTTYNGSNVYYRQTVDINVSAYWWDSIGTSSSSTYYFRGHYDGDGYTVSGIYTPAGSDSTYSYQGLFGYVYGASSTNRAGISNVGVIDSNIQGYQSVGGIAGRVYYADITNCYNTSSVTGSSSYVGGVVGYNSSSTVTNCYKTGSVTGSSLSVGGVVGYNSSSTVSNSYNTGSVTGTQNVGGVVGFSVESSTVIDSYNIGDITGSGQYVGGVVGYNNSSIVSNSYNTGSVTGTRNVGGVAGYNGNSSEITNSYNTGDVSGTTNIGGVVGQNYSGTIRNTYNMGNITGTTYYAGGVVGYNITDSYVYNSYNTGSVIGVTYVGGVVGGNSATSIVSNSFNTGSVTGSGSSVGGVVGNNSTSTSVVSYCYYGINCTQSSAYGINNSGGIVSNCSTFSSDNDPKTLSWFTTTSNWNSSYPWDFETVWALSTYFNDGYPCLINVGDSRPGNPMYLWTDDEVTTRDTDFEGSGTASDPYLISSAEELAGLAYLTNISSSNTYNSSNVYYLQTADIDVSAYWWDAIGTSTSTSYYFQGHYDGGGYTVSGIYTQPGSSSTYNDQGLFGYVRGTSSTKRAEISNVGVIDSNIQGYRYVGGVAGRAYYTNITNCYNMGSVTGSSYYIGGVVGYNYQATVENSYNTGSVTSSGGNVGGVVGYNYSSATVSNSYNTGTVTGSSNYVGGVVGYNYSLSTVENSYNTGSVLSSSGHVGGVVGYNYVSSTVSNSYNTGSVLSSSGYVGGVVGQNSSSTVENSYNTGDVTSTYTGTYGHVGGVAGYNNSTVTNSYNTGSVTASAQRVGGVVGYNYDSSARITNTYNTGSVSGTLYVAGVVGYNYNGADVYNSFNTGSVTGTGSYIGAIVGRNYSNSPTVYNCYWGVNCTQTSAYGSNGGTVSNCSRFESDYEPSSINWYLDSENWYSSYPWDFENVWTIDGSVNNGYPILIQTKFLTINIIYSGMVRPEIEITTSGGELSSDNVLSTTTTENPIAINFENITSRINVYIAFNEEPTTESDLNSATYLWDLTTGVLNVYVYQQRFITYHSNNESNESVSYEYVGTETINAIANPFDAEEGYHFVNWNMSADGTSVNFEEDSILTSAFSIELDLYAQWSGDVYNITFNHGNGTSTAYYLKYGTGLYQNNPGDNSASAPLEVIAPITRDGYTFHGYYTGQNGTGEQIIDENGNVVGSPTFTLSPTTIYAYWTVNVPAYYDEAGGYWYIEYGKMPQTKLDSSVQEDLIIINALNGDSVLDDTDGVISSPNSYYFAGVVLQAKIYDGEEYCNLEGNWYQVEPIRWILITDASSTQSGYISTDTMAVMESVVYVGKYSDTALSLGNGYVSANSVSGSDVNYFYNNFLLNERLYLTEFTAESSAFSSSSITTSETSTSYIFLSSNEEINEAKGNYETEFSDFVKDYLDMIGQNDLYYVRDLGSNLNTVSSHTEGGGTVNSKPTDFLGMRFTIQVSEYVCLS